jgi:hypothetical protein
MTEFISRVELHEVGTSKPTEEHYKSLHAAMEAKGFQRTVNSSDGKKYEMPHATYYRISSSTLAQIHKDAQGAAATTWSKHGIVSIHAAGVLLSGLKLA